MIYSSIYEILIAAISFFALGIIFGGLYNSFSYFYLFIKGMLFLPRNAYLKYAKKREKDYKTKQKSHNHFIDFVFVFLFGIFYILFSYVFLDGSLRLFSLFFTAAGYMISFKILSLFFTLAVSKVISGILKISEQLVFIFLLPLFKTLTIIKKLILPIINTLQLKFELKKYNALKRKKGIMIEKALFKTDARI